jgi:hypothetical protein
MTLAHTIQRARLAQSLLEYVYVVGIVAALLVAMQVYMTRGIQAGVKYAADELGSQEGLPLESRMVTEHASEYTEDTANSRTEQVGSGGSRLRTMDHTTISSGDSEQVTITYEGEVP